MEEDSGETSKKGSWEKLFKRSGGKKLSKTHSEEIGGTVPQVIPQEVENDPTDIFGGLPVASDEKPTGRQIESQGNNLNQAPENSQQGEKLSFPLLSTDRAKGSIKIPTRPTGAASQPRNDRGTVKEAPVKAR